MSRKMQPVDTAEREKISKLKNEIKTDSGKVEWIYSGNSIDRDAYLLGKPIDKLILEKESEKPKETQLVTSTIDLANKIREDPLFEIKKREIEAKKRLLENPLKLKQLQQMLAPKRGASEEEEGSDDDSDRHRKKHKKHHKKRDRRPTRSRSRSPRPSDGYGLSKPKTSSSHSSNHPEKSEKTREIESYKERINKLKDIKSSGGASGSSRSTKTMSESERQRRLEEMQSNAKWRDEVRVKNVKRLDTEEKNERRLEEVSRSNRMQAEASNMFNNIMKDAYKSTQDRIRSNVYNIQRNKSSYDANFARK